LLYQQKKENYFERELKSNITLGKIWYKYKGTTWRVADGCIARYTEKVEEQCSTFLGKKSFINKWSSIFKYSSANKYDKNI